MLAAAPVGQLHQAFEVGKAKGINFGFDDMEKLPGSYDPVGCVRPCVRTERGRSLSPKLTFFGRCLSAVAKSYSQK